MNDICVLCKQFLKDYITVYEKQIRGDHENKCKIIQCANCDHIQLIGFRENLKNHYDEDEQSNDIVKTFNITKEDIIDKEKIEIDRRINFISDFIGLENQNVLDIGAGYGTFAKKIYDKYNNLNITIIEPSIKRTTIGTHVNEIDVNKISIYNNFLDDDFAKQNCEKYDVITMWHVLEHVDHNNIDSLLSNIYKCCKKDGKIFIEVPNSDDELLRLDKYKKINYMIHHISYWNCRSMEKILQRNNMNNFKIFSVQRYGFSNYLNWIYDLGKKMDCDMNDDKSNIEWLNAKKTSGKTDAILAVITKQ